MNTYPRCFSGWPVETLRPSSFPWESTDVFVIPKLSGFARLEYKNGWTRMTLWTKQNYFVEQTLSFEETLDLLKKRFVSHEYLHLPIVREFRLVR